MSDRGIEFATHWVQENINVEPYDVPDAMIRSAVEKLLADAAAQGITREEIEEDMGDIHDFISDSYESRTDAEVERLASKDD